MSCSAGDEEREEAKGGTSRLILLCPGCFLSDGGVCCGECRAARPPRSFRGVQEPVWAPALLEDYRAVAHCGLCTVTMARCCSEDGINNMISFLVLLFISALFSFASSLHFYFFFCASILFSLLFRISLSLSLNLLLSSGRFSQPWAFN